MYSIIVPMCCLVHRSERMNYYEHQQHAGYYYIWITPLQQWGMKWRPIKDTYSPPLLDQSLQWIHIAPPQGLNMVPLLGYSEDLANKIGATYLYYRKDLNKIEIWAQDITSATTKLSIHLRQVKERRISTTTSNTKLIPPL